MVRKKYRVAITGGAASGKSTLCAFLEKKGLKVISSDILAREVVQPGEEAYNKIVSAFGMKVVSSDGGLDRGMLRKIITEDKKSRSVLEEIVQPAIISLMRKKMSGYFSEGETVVVAEVPLLFELSLESDFDLNVLLSVEKDVQVSRLSLRDGVDSAAAGALLDLQMTDGEKRILADYIIDNNHGEAELMEKCSELYLLISQDEAVRSDDEKDH